jgi:SAM-dependent methyltransferase
MPIHNDNLLNAVYWDLKYQNQETGWDIGTVSEPLKCYINQLEDKNIRILIPGCGNAYEAKYLHEKGFKNIAVIDISETLVQKLKNELLNFENINIILGDFFEHEATYDFILEQTFFCAIHPSLRNAYASKMHQILSKKGKLVGLLFDKNFETGPPFGGSHEVYQELCSRCDVTPLQCSLL